jgi:hypothetical protein
VLLVVRMSIIKFHGYDVLADTSIWPWVSNLRPACRVYTTTTHDNFDCQKYHLLLVLDVLPANQPIIIGVAVWHKNVGRPSDWTH